MDYIVDRFENDIAVIELENKTFINIPRAALPSEAKEGDVISVTVDLKSTGVRKKKIQNLMDELFE